MIPLEELREELIPYKFFISRKYIPHLICIFIIHGITTLAVLIDRQHNERNAIKMCIFLCFLLAVNVGFALFFSLLYFNIIL